MDKRPATPRLLPLADFAWAGAAYEFVGDGGHAEDCFFRPTEIVQPQADLPEPVRAAWRRPKREGAMYRPFADAPFLYREFASLNATRPGEILSFIEHRGPLFGWPVGEALSLWAQESISMYAALLLWEGLSASDLAKINEGCGALRGLPRFQEFVASNDRGEEWRWADYVNLDPEYTHPGPYDDLDTGKRRAFDLVAAMFNFRFERTAGVFLVSQPHRWRYEARVHPRNLCGALWLQFHLSIEGFSQTRECAECGRLFKIDPQEGTRSSRIYCGNPCKVRAYRKRRAEARRLHAEGLSPAKIADSVGADTKTVRGWIKGRKRRTRRKA